MVFSLWRLAAVLALSGCTCVPLIGTAPFRCETDEACAENHVCRQGTCLRLGTFVEDGGFVTPPTTPNGTFQLASTAVGYGRALTLADMDDDGILDAVMIDNGAVVVNKGRGDRTFGVELVRIGAPEDRYMVDLVVADFDGDGRRDVAFSCGSVGSVFVALNAGGGTFGRVAEYEMPTGNLNVTSLVAGDFTGDGRIDLLVYMTNEMMLYVLPARADGTFGRVIASRNGLPNVNNGRVAQGIDINRDGKLDVLASGNSGSNSIDLMYGKGDGTFMNGRRLFVPSCAVSFVRAGDYLGDEAVELLTSCQGRALAFLQLQDETLTQVGQVPMSFNVNFYDGSYGTHIVSADINGDGRLDLVLFDGTVVLNSETGFTEPLLSQLYPSYDADTREFAVGDTDGNGTADLVMLSKGPYIKVASGTGNGVLSAIRASGYGRLIVGVTSQLNTVVSAAGDFTGDGRVDLAVALAPQLVTIVPQPKTPLFVGARDLPAVRVDLTATDMQAADFDLDGRTDLVVMGSTAIRLMRGRGDGTFISGPLLALSSEGTSLTVADVNEDHFPDVLVAIRSADVVDVFANAGDGALVKYPSVTGDLAAPWAVYTGDLTGDGHLDLLVSRLSMTGTRGVGLAVGDGEGHFAPLVDVIPPSMDATYSIGLGDINGDGRLDFVRHHGITLDSMGRLGSAITLHTARGDGTYDSARLEMTAGVSTVPRRGVQLRDVNADGFLDLLVTGESGWKMVRGTATGLSGEKTEVSSFRAGRSSGTFFFDANGDGLIDQVLVNGSPVGISFLLAQ